MSIEFIDWATEVFDIFSRDPNFRRKPLIVLVLNCRTSAYQAHSKNTSETSRSEKKRVFLVKEGLLPLLFIHDGHKNERLLGVNQWRDLVPFYGEPMSDCLLEFPVLYNRSL